MTRLLGKLRLCLMLGAIVGSASGCVFGGSLYVNVFEGTVSIVATDVTIGSCFLDDDGHTYRCLNNSIFSAFETITEAELLLKLVLLDPLVVQLPADFTAFSGTYTPNGSTGGALAITAGLASLPIDADRSLVAEPGMQLVVVGLPDGAPTTGNFDFLLSFKVPPGTMTIAAKPIITGLAKLTTGITYYPPILPCVGSVADAPTVDIPLGVSGVLVPLPPLTPALGCSGVSYNFVPGGTTSTTLPGGESCGNCRDDDGNGLVDFEDPACCGGAPREMAVRRAKLKPHGAGSSMLLKTKHPDLGLGGTPAPRDIFVQLRPEGGETYCAHVPADRLRGKGKGLRFQDKRREVASAAGLTSLKVRAKPTGAAVVSMGAKEATLGTPGAGPLHVAFGLVDPAAPTTGTLCSGTTATLRSRGGGVRFP